MQNAFVESFIGRFRDECLNENVFTKLAEARSLIEEWRIDYNTNRPHTSLGGLAPAVRVGCDARWRHTHIGLPRQPGARLDRHNRLPG